MTTTNSFNDDFQGRFIEKLRRQKAYLFLTKVIREAVMRMLDVGRPYPVLAENDLISRSIVYHWLKDCCLDATAELLQAETYERLLNTEQLSLFVENFTIDSLSEHFRVYPPKVGKVLPRETWVHDQEEKSFDIKEARESQPTLFDAKLPPNKAALPIESRLSTQKSVDPIDISPSVEQQSAPTSPIRAVADGRASSAQSSIGSAKQSLNNNLLQSMSNLRKTIQTPTQPTPQLEKVQQAKDVNPSSSSSVSSSNASSSSSASSPQEEPTGNTSWFNRSPIHSSKAPIEPLIGISKPLFSTTSSLPPLGASPSLPPLGRSLGGLRSIAALDFNEKLESSSDSETDQTPREGNQSTELASQSSTHSTPAADTPKSSNGAKIPIDPIKTETFSPKTTEKVSPGDEQKDLTDQRVRVEEVEVDEELAELDVDDLLQSDAASSISF